MTGGQGAVPGPMALYVALARIRFRRMMAYRGATLAGLVTNFFFGMLRAYVFIALFAATDSERVAGYSVADAVTYTAITQAIIAPLMIFGSWEVMRTIQSGQIASDLTKPLDFYGFWLAQDLGRSAFHVLARGVPIMVAYPLVFDMTWPDSGGRWLAFSLSVLLAVLIGFSWRFLVNVTAFWTMDATGFGRIAFMGTLLLSGFVVPVAFFPDWARQLMGALPFASMINTPVEVYVGRVSGAALWRALIVQGMWVVAMAAAARGAYRMGVRRLVVQGG